MMARRRGAARRWVSVLAAVLLVMAPAVVSLGASARPAHAGTLDEIDCEPYYTCPGDPLGFSLGFDNGSCFYNSCADREIPLESGDYCSLLLCPDNQDTPERQCPIVVNDDGSLTCTVEDPGPDNPPPSNCLTNNCPDPITEVPIDQTTCAPEDDPGTYFNQDSFTSIALGTDQFPDMDPLFASDCGPTQPPAPGPTQFGATDVAFGDSFISGEGDLSKFGGNYVDSPEGPAGTCDVSDDAWPHLAFEASVVAGKALDAVFNRSSNRRFENWACTGATTDGVLKQISDAAYNGGQDFNTSGLRWAGLGAATTDVQLSVGGNDLGFGDAIKCAVKHSALLYENEHAFNGTSRCIPTTDQLKQKIADIGLVAKLTKVYNAILTAVPGVRLEVADYPMLFPQGSSPPCGVFGIDVTRADQMDINNDTLELDQVIRTTAVSVGAKFIEFSGALQHATICDKPNGVNTDWAAAAHFNLKGAFHPNAYGHQFLLDAYTKGDFFNTAGAAASFPPTGTLVGDRFGGGVFFSVGGALWPFANQPEVLNTGYKTTNIMLEPSNQIAVQESAMPADGTHVRSVVSGTSFIVQTESPFNVKALVPQSPTAGGWPVPDSSLGGYKLADGYFFTVAGGDGRVYEIIGGAPVLVTDWSHVGGVHPVYNMSQAQFDALPQYPRDGSFAVNSSGLVYEFIGGAPVVVTDWNNVGGFPSYNLSPSNNFGGIPIVDDTSVANAGNGGGWNHLRQYPADGTLAVATVPLVSVDDPGTYYYLFAGGAPILVSDWSQLGGQPSGPLTPIDYISIDNAGTGGAWNHLRPQPADGTVLQSGSTGTIYQVEGGTPEPGCNPAASPVVIDQTALDNAGTGGAFNHLNPPASGCTASGLDDHASAFSIFYGSPGTGNASVTNVTSPAEDGSALDLNYQSGNQAYQNITAYTKPGTSDTATTYHLNLDFSLPVTAPVQAVDFSMSNYVQNSRYQWALQWEGKGTGAPQWRIWTGSGWQDTGISAPLQAGTWYHLSLDGSNIGGTVRYDDFTISGQTHSLTAAFSPAAQTGDGLVASVTLSGDSAADPYHVYLDNAHFTWTGGAAWPADLAALAQTAFQANTGHLWAIGGSAAGDQGIAMMTGTSPAAARLSDGTLKIAYQGTNGDLWVTSPGATPADTGFGMLKGTSPAITALPGGGWMAAFQANTGNLWVTGTAGTGDQQLGMMAGTSPAITTLSTGSAEIAFQANTGHLWTDIPGPDASAQTRTAQDQQFGMMAGTSPALTALSNGQFEVAFQANTGHLWTIDPNVSGGDLGFGMMAGTSPALTALSNGQFEVAFQANTGNLWTIDPNVSGGDQNLGMMKGTSPAITPTS